MNSPLIPSLFHRYDFRFLGRETEKELEIIRSEKFQKTYYVPVPDMVESYYLVAARMKKYENFCPNFTHHMVWWSLPRTSLL